VAYNSLLLKRRKEIHEKIGKAIEELYPERLEEFYEMLAYHYARGCLSLGEVYDKAGQKEKAMENLKKAETMFQEMGMNYWLATTRKVLAGL
jgi:predicted ATPase